MIIEAGRLAPTGTNAQGTSCIILNKKKRDCEAVAVKMFRKIKNILGLKGKIYPVTTLVIGYPAAKYRRTVHRKSADIIEA